MKKLINDKIFKINDSAEIRCSWFNTKYGFKHEAELYVNGIFQMKAKVCYYNRTWESFEYETVLRDLLKKAKLFDDSIESLLSQWQKGYIDEVHSNFGMLAGIMQLGNLIAEGQKAQNDFKARMLRAGLGDAVMMPKDWGTLPEAEKEKRLNGIIELFSNKQGHGCSCE